MFRRTGVSPVRQFPRSVAEPRNADRRQSLKAVDWGLDRKCQKICRRLKEASASASLGKEIKYKK